MKDTQQLLPNKKFKKKPFFVSGHSQSQYPAASYTYNATLSVVVLATMLIWIITQDSTVIQNGFIKTQKHTT
jgi:hypothetical protein